MLRYCEEIIREKVKGTWKLGVGKGIQERADVRIWLGGLQTLKHQTNCITG